MTYYDLKTNEIWADSNIAGFHDEHIEIDEVIAPLIRELNIKGYKTKFCCSGHPFYSLCEAMVDSEETAKAFVGLIGTERTDNPRMPVRALYVTPDNDFYITFEENEQEAITVPFPVSWTVKMKKKQKETQYILAYHTQAAGGSDKARAKAAGGRQPIEECGRTGL